MSTVRSTLNTKVIAAVVMAAGALGACSANPKDVTPASTSVSTPATTAPQAFSSFFESNEETKIASGTESGSALVASQAYASLEYGGVKIPEGSYYLLSVTPEGSVAYLLGEGTSSVSLPRPAGPGSFVFEVRSKTGRRLSMLRDGVVSDVFALPDDKELVSFVTVGDDMLFVAQGSSVRAVSLDSREVTARLDIPTATVQDLTSGGDSVLVVASSSGSEAVEIANTSVPSDAWFVLPLDLELRMGKPVIVGGTEEESPLGVELLPLGAGLFKATAITYSSEARGVASPALVFDAYGERRFVSGVLSTFDLVELAASNDGGTLRTSDGSALTYFKDDKILWKTPALCAAESSYCTIGTWSNGALIKEQLEEAETAKGATEASSTGVPEWATSALRFLPVP